MSMDWEWEVVFAAETRTEIKEHKWGTNVSLSLHFSEEESMGLGDSFCYQSKLPFIKPVREKGKMSSPHSKLIDLLE